jgi:GT2 family glycosyltransferase
VIVCAFASRRLEQTVQCVESVLAQRPRPEQVIVVVDHNEPLRSELQSRLPADVQVVPNDGEPGLSSARNTAVALSRCELDVFIDDDARARDGWLAGLLTAFDDPAVLGAGGHALPAWEGSPPRWLPEEFLWAVGCSYRGLPPAGPVRNPLGCNMAFRSTLFRRVGLFDPAIGRLGSRPLGCEETEFCVRAAREIPGAQLVLVAGAEIDHCVTGERATMRYLLRRCYYEGISKALVRRLGDVRSLDTERTYVRRALRARLTSSLRSAVFGGDRVAALGQAIAVVGALAAAAAGYIFGGIVFSLRPPAAAPPKLALPASSPAQA